MSVSFGSNSPPPPPPPTPPSLTCQTVAFWNPIHTFAILVFLSKGNQSDQLTRVQGQFCNMSASKDSTKPDAGPAHIGKGIKFLFGGTAGWVVSVTIRRPVRPWQHFFPSEARWRCGEKGQIACWRAVPLFAKAKPNDGEGFKMTCVACLTAPTLRQHSLFLKFAFELVEEDTLI